MKESSQTPQLLYTVHPLVLLVEAIGFTAVLCMIAAINSTQLSTSSPLQPSSEGQQAQVKSAQVKPAVY